ncbi:hypothetical protein SK128_012889 [Halocaridina rubra]|uniref:Uncharacterized protein n=1 Tax=Halocaridina rubra TaxID=373956 RepID=A0AAN9A510_HALRR
MEMFHIFSYKLWPIGILQAFFMWLSSNSYVILLRYISGQKVKGTILVSSQNDNLDMKAKLFTCVSINTSSFLMTLAFSCSSSDQKMPRMQTRAMRRRRMEEEVRSGKDGIGPPSEAPGPPKRTDEVSPGRPFFPDPPVVLGRALTAEDGRKILLRRLLRRERRPLKIPLLRVLVDRPRLPAYVDKLKVISSYYARHSKKRKRRRKRK